MAACPPIHYTPDLQFPRGISADPAVANANFCRRSHLDLGRSASQTRFMAHSYIRFDFGTDEEKAQQARHKMDGWRQAFRLDKKLQYKLDRPDSAAVETISKPEPAAKAAPLEKSKEKAAAAANGKVSLLVRLYFSSHEKLSEQRWLDRIPSEEPFKSASPKVIHQGDTEFETTDKQFETLA